MVHLCLPPKMNAPAAGGGHLPSRMRRREGGYPPSLATCDSGKEGHPVSANEAAAGMGVIPPRRMKRRRGAAVAGAGRLPPANAGAPEGFGRINKDLKADWWTTNKAASQTWCEGCLHPVNSNHWLTTYIVFHVRRGEMYGLLRRGWLFLWPLGQRIVVSCPLRNPPRQT